VAAQQQEQVAAPEQGQAAPQQEQAAPQQQQDEKLAPEHSEN
jgi:hypothetical protein